MSKLLEESRIHEQNEKRMSKSHWASRTETKMATKQVHHQQIKSANPDTVLSLS